MADKKELAVLAENIVSSVTKKVEGLEKAGMQFAKDFNPINALRSSMLILQDMKDKNGKLVLESCSSGSIARALFNMLSKSLDASKGQMYFIPYGENLTAQESYFGSVTRAKRAVPDYVPIVKIIREGDKFIMENDVETGETKVVKHETSFDNLDKPIIGAYTWAYYPNGKKDLVIMTMASIQRSWAQSSNGGLVAKKFPEEMVKRTLLRKACKMMVNTDISNGSPISSLEEDLGIDIDASRQLGTEQVGEVVEYEEVTETVDASTLNNKEELSGANASAGEPETIKEEKKKQVKKRPF